jgi:transcriptional regulator with GAF, ATPase, and Fis domain
VEAYFNLRFHKKFKGPKMSNSSSQPDPSTLLDFVLILNRQSNFDEILRLVAHKTSDILRAESVQLMMINPRTHETIKTVIREGKKVSTPGLDSLQSQITGWMMHNQTPLISADIKQDGRFAELKMTDQPVQSAIAVLLKIENMILGSIVVFRSEKAKPFADSDLTVLKYIAAMSAPYLHNVERIQEFFTPDIPESALLQKYAEAGLIGASKNFLALLQAIEAAARCDVRVVLEGESGTGKELIARAIHRFSSRHDQPFIAVDCGAIAEHLLESELFGHTKGAFTGATRDRKGLIQEADGGTLFIDEIANLPLEMQTKFMRFLQEGEVRPVGASIPQKVNLRIVSAASQSLRRLTEEGKFREDLFFRMHVYPISVPSLRDRDKDIALLANHFLAKFSKGQDKKVNSFHPDTIQFMRQRAWQGNIRELENFVERLVTLASSQTTVLEYDILPADLKDEYNRFALNQEVQLVNKSLKERLQSCEEKIIRQSLIEKHWNQSAAARALGISEQILRYKMKKLGVRRPK